MATTLPRTGLPVWLALTTLAVAAQTAAAASGTPAAAATGGAAASAAAIGRSPAASAPAAAAATAPRGPYRSDFAGYRGFSEQPLAPWRESNDTVGRIGGWRAYARESQGEPAPSPKPAASAAAPAPKPAPRTGGHADHHR